MGYRIGELARLAAVTPRAIRFYEEQGLLPAPQRAPNGYREYGQAILRRLQYIRRLQALGFQLSEIAFLLHALDAGSCPCEPGRGVVDAKLRRCEQQIRALARQRRQLLELRARLATPGECQAPCACGGGA